MKQVYTLLLALVCLLSLSFTADVAHGASTELVVREDAPAMAAALQDYTKSRLSQAQADLIVATVLNESSLRKVDPLVILALMGQESTFNTKAKSPDGSYGLMQVNYRVHRKSFKGESPFNIASSVRVGMNVFVECSTKTKGDIYATLNCYSGGGAQKYYKRYVASRKKIEKAYLMALFAPPPTIVASL